MEEVDRQTNTVIIYSLASAFTKGENVLYLDTQHF